MNDSLNDGIWILALIPYLLLFFLILTIVSYWKIFKKASKPPWITLIPIYNLVVLHDIIGLSRIYVLYWFIPLVNILILIYCRFQISRKFKRGILFSILTVIFPFIFLPIIAFGKSSYKHED